MAKPNENMEKPHVRETLPIPELVGRSSNPKIYQITLKGHLNQYWADWFDGMALSHERNGSTMLTGEVVDQAALHGLL